MNCRWIQRHSIHDAPSPYARRRLDAEARHVGRKTHREFAARPTVLQPQVSLSASFRAERPRQLQAAFPLTLALSQGRGNTAPRPATSRGALDCRKRGERWAERGCVRRTSRSRAEDEDALKQSDALLPAMILRLGASPTAALRPLERTLPLCFGPRETSDGLNAVSNRRNCKRSCMNREPPQLLRPPK